MIKLAVVQSYVCLIVHTVSFVVICLFVSAFTGGILKQAVGHFWGYTPRFFEKLFTMAFPGFLTFGGILAAGVYQMEVHPLRFLKKNDRIVRTGPDKSTSSPRTLSGREGEALAARGQQARSRGN